MDGNLLIRIGCDEASDSWGFVGVVSVGDVEAYRTLEAFTTPGDATAAAQRLMADLLGELLAGREWRAVRDEHGTMPTREHFKFSAMGGQPPIKPTPREPFEPAP